MAGIDRIYVNSVEQWREFYTWATQHRDACKGKTGCNILDYFYFNNEQEVIECLEYNRKRYIERLLELENIIKLGPNNPKYARTFAVYYEEMPEDLNHPDWVAKATYGEFENEYIANKKSEIERYRTTGEVECDLHCTSFSQVIDRYVIQNCDIDFVVERLKEQYSDYENIRNNTDKYSVEYIYEPCTKVTLRYPNGWKFRKSTANRGLFVDIITNDDDNDWRYDEDNDRWVNTAKELKRYTTNIANNSYSVKAVVRKIMKVWKLPKGLTIRVDGPYEGEELIITTK
jgi:hypothetical protein